jgi:hypothetical protein
MVVYGIRGRDAEVFHCVGMRKSTKKPVRLCGGLR